MLALYFRGYSYAGQRQFDKAIADYNQVTRLNRSLKKPLGNDRMVWVYFFRGYSYAGQRQFDRAIVDYSQAIKLYPKYALAYGNRGHAYYHKGDHEKVIADARMALSIDPSLESAKQLLQELGV